jgi:hypothetical protein
VKDAENVDPTPDLSPVAKTQPLVDTEQARLARLEQERAEIENGKVMDEFLTHPVVAKAFADLGKRYYGAFIAADSPEDRDASWALSRALLDLAKELRSVCDGGRTAEHARKVRSQRERVNDRRPRR